MASDKDIVVEARELFKDASPRPWLVEVHDARGDYAKIALVTRNGYFETGYYVIADDDMECRREQAIADFKAISRAPELLRALADEVERLRRGDFSPEEFQNLCHNTDIREGFDAFADGCEMYQQKLFGRCRTKGEVL